jgi:hypothetical protein
MRAAQVSELGGSPQVVDLPEPDHADLTVEAVALNPLDINIAALATSRSDRAQVAAASN